MSLLREWQQVEVRDFIGAWTDMEPTDVPTTRALRAENVEYFPGQVRLPRFGFGSIQTPGDAIRSMENWIHSYQGIYYNLLCYFATSGTHAGITLLDLTSGVYTPLYVPSGGTVGACFVSAGTRLYMSTFTAALYGSDQPRVYIKEFDFSSFPNTADPIYPVPTPTTISAMQSVIASNSVTQGTHLISFVMVSRSGYTTKPFNAPLSFDFVNTNEINVTLTPATVWPNWFAGFQLIMTTADNPGQFFLVPGTLVSVPGLGGLSTPVSTMIGITDDDLTATAVDATPYFSRYSPTHFPSVISTYGSRMCYINTTDDLAAQSVMYISEPNDFQNITADQNAIYLPGQQAMVTQFSLYNTLYILGPHWTYQTADTGDKPVLWQQPLLVDGRIGTLCPLGVTVNASGGFAWVVDTAGLYLFQGGAYSPRPISYYNADVWARINFAAATAIKVVDDTQRQRVRVLVPLDGATAPTHILTWDYSRGLTPEQMSFSLDTIQSYALGSIAYVQNDTTKAVECWLGPNDTTKPVVRQARATDTNPYRDNGAAILPAYQTSLLPLASADVLQHHGDHLRLTGSGTLKVNVLTLDSGRNIALNNITLSETPALLYLRRYHTLSEAASLLLTTTDLDDQVILSGLTHYYTPWVTNR